MAPTAFDWLKGDFFKADLVDITSVDEEVLRAAAFSCPTQAIIIEELEEFLPAQLRDTRTSEPKRVAKTFMFTDIVKSTNLIEVIGDEAWNTLLHWHDQTLRSIFSTNHGEEVSTTGDGFFVSFDNPEAALACAVAIQRKLAEHRQSQGFAPQVRIGLHSSDATQADGNFSGKGVHEAARIGALAQAGEILASKRAAGGTRFSISEPREVTLKGILEPVEVVTINWR